MGGKFGMKWITTPRSITSPSYADLREAAGFLEGEGYFRCRKSRYLTMGAGQKEQEPLNKLQRWFGGTIKHQSSGYKGSRIWRWEIYGARAAGVMMTMYSSLCTRRRTQIERALDTWRIN